MKKLLNNLKNNETGSVLMEFLLVAPIYLALLGGLYSVNELVWLNNRVAITDRNLGYDVQISDAHLRESVWGADNLGYTEKNKKGADLASFDLYEANNEQGSVVDLATVRHWGGYRTSYITLLNQKMPSFVVGMRNVIHMFSGEPLDIDDYVSSVGQLPSDAYRDGSEDEVLHGRHFLLYRNTIGATDRIAMYNVRNDGSTATHYGQAPNYVNNWSVVGGKDIISAPLQRYVPKKSQDVTASNGVYERFYQNFFTEMSGN